MVTPAERSQEGNESTAHYSTNVQNVVAREELEQNNSEGVAYEASDESKGKRKLIHPTDEQKTELEEFFKHNPHLTANQREELTRILELQDSIQIRSWLRNRSKQLKVNGERDEDEILQAQINERLKNISLKEEEERYMMLPAENCSKIEKALLRDNTEAILGLVRSATEELRLMAVSNEPLWRHNSADDGSRILDKAEYHRIFRNLVGPRQIGFASEASRETARIKLSPKHLVNLFMDVSKWSDMFNAIVAKAMVVDVLMNPGGALDYDGTLQVMAAQYQFLTPLPNRESYFARYCKKKSETEWIVVDVSLDGVHHVPGLSCKKRPSGCLIHESSAGFSEITWVEHVDVDYKDVNPMYRILLVSHLGFEARRWISTLDKQCQYMETNISIKVPLREYNYLLMTSDLKAWKVILKLAERMVTSFNSGISGSTGKWEKLSGHFTDNIDNIRVMIRRIRDDPSLPRGTLVTASSSFWLPMSQKSVFDFFHGHNSRSEPMIPYAGREWAVLSDENVNIEQVCHISDSQKANDYVSIHKLQTDSSRENILLLQESCDDPIASYIVYSRLNTWDMDMILSGRTSDYIRILPSGFVVLPDGPAYGTKGFGGSFMTISFQLLVDESPEFILPATMHSRVTNLLKFTTERIMVALGFRKPNVQS